MGWDFCDDWISVALVKASLLRDWRAAGLTVKAMGPGREYGETHAWWVALETPSKGGKDNVSFVACVLIEPDSDGGKRPMYGCKIIDESMGPAFDCCPEHVFRAARGSGGNIAAEWRARVLRNAEWARKARAASEEHDPRCATEIDGTLRCTCERERDYDASVRS
jgi:hypothetical protein